MLVIGCDFHPSWQPVCWVDTITGETEEKKSVHGSGEAEANRSPVDLGSELKQQLSHPILMQ
jgi:hypothetical protein